MLLQFRWLEHSTDNRKVAGSIPAKSTSKRDSGSNPALGPVVQLGQNALTPNLTVNGPYVRDIRQQFSLARTRDLGSRGRGFESLLPDQHNVNYFITAHTNNFGVVPDWQGVVFSLPISKYSSAGRAPALTRWEVIGSSPIVSSIKDTYSKPSLIEDCGFKSHRSCALAFRRNWFTRLT